MGKPRVLVLDAQLRHSVAIVRSLGRGGLDVVCASPTRWAPAHTSRYAAASHLLRYDRDTVLDDLLSIIEKESIDFVIPAGLPGNELICRHRSVLEPVVRAPFNDLDTFELMANKRDVVELAGALGVPHPHTVQITGLDDLEGFVHDLTYPIVFKSAVDQGTVRYAGDTGELRSIVQEFWQGNPALIHAGRFPIVQEYIEGSGHGYYALADRGKVVASFMHRRLHEVPMSGGPSSMAASYRDAELARLGERFVSEAAWTGVVMVEFKKSARDGRYYVIEVNPKFWGSLQLSIAAGVDFPLLLYRMLTTGWAPARPDEYLDDYVYRWLALDLAHAVETRRLGAYFRTFANRRVHDDLVVKDLIPFLMLFAIGVGRQLHSMLRRGDHA